MLIRVKEKTTKEESCFKRLMVRLMSALGNENGSEHTNTAIKIIAGIVIGSLILLFIINMFDTTLLPTIATKISDMFSAS